MLKNYLLVALRSFRRRLGYASINVVGLGVGIACCAVIGLYVWGELIYDRFHEDAELIYRVESTFGDVISLASVNYPFVNVLKTEFTEYPIATITRSTGNGAVRRGETLFREEDILFANAGFFDVFSFNLEHGDERSALAEPYSVVITREVADRYFRDENPIGETLQVLGEWDVTVTGVLASPEGPTHMPLTVLISWATLESIGWGQLETWSANNTFTYVRFPSQAAAASVEAMLPDLIERHAGDNWPGSTLSLRPLTDIHLHSTHTGELLPGGNLAYVTLFGIVAGFILLLAAVNFVNLSTARSLERAREVGVRKSMGAVKGQLARQFLAEALILAVTGLLVAIVLISLAVPSLAGVVGRPLLPEMGSLGVAALVALAATAVVGIGGGLYPALALSRFRPVEVLRGQSSGGLRGALLRRGLVVFQFGVATVLLVGTFVVYGQLQHMRSADLGFDEAQVLAIRGPGVPTSQRLAFFEAVTGEAAVEYAASVGEQLPAELRSGGGITLPGYIPEEGTELPTFTRFVATSGGFFETLGVRFMAGRGFRTGSAADSAGVILNESAARVVMAQAPDRFDTPADLVGETVLIGDESQVIGIVENFHMASLHSPVVPMTFVLGSAGATYVVRTAPGAADRALDAVRDHWAALFPDVPFEYRYVDDSFAAAYRAEERLGRLALIFAALAILVACLGLFGLAAYAAEQRRKEIGVRKVLGATVASVTALLAKYFVRLVVVAVVIGVPIAWYGAARWLEGFPSRIELGPAPFVVAGTLAVFIGLATVSGQAIRAAIVDPAIALRTE